MSWNFIGTVQKSTSVSHSCVGYFTASDQRNLILAKGTRVEIYVFKSDQTLEFVFDRPMCGKIAAINLFRPQGVGKDLLFVLTEFCRYFVFSWDEEVSVLKIRDEDECFDGFDCHTNNRQIADIDRNCQIICLHHFDKTLKFIPMYGQGQLEKAVSKRLTVRVLDMKFKHVSSVTVPSIWVLSKDDSGDCSLVRFHIDLHSEDVLEHAWSSNALDKTAYFIISEPGGAIVLAERMISYYGDTECTLELTEPLIIRAYGELETSKFLLSCSNGFLYMLEIIHGAGMERKLKLVNLGFKTSIASTVSYLDHDIVFVGSCYGDSHLIALNSQDGQLLESYANFGPIVDFCVADLDRLDKDHGQLVLCSGAYKMGSLRVIHNGVRITDTISEEVPGLKRMWSVNSKIYGEILVLSLTRDTLLLKVDSDGIEQLGNAIGFDEESETLFCANVIDDQIIQVTNKDIILVDSLSQQVNDQWKHSGFKITVATANYSQVLIACKDQIFSIKISGKKLQKMNEVTLESDVSCLAINHTSAENFFAAVGLWDESVSMFTIPDLRKMSSESLSDNFIARSIAFYKFKEETYFLCGLGNGDLLSFLLDSSSGVLSKRKKIGLGFEAPNLCVFTRSDRQYIFIASDRPTLVEGRDEGLVYFDINLEYSSWVCPVYYLNKFAIARKEELLLVDIDEIQKSITYEIASGEEVSHACHLRSSESIVYCCYQEDRNVIIAVNDETFQLQFSYKLEVDEQPLTTAKCFFNEGDNDYEYYCVGTAMLDNHKEPRKGRILIFGVLLEENKKLELIINKDVDGAVYALKELQGHLVCSLLSSIQVYTWKKDGSQCHSLEFCCERQVHFIVCLQTRNQYIAAGDLTQSISLYQFEGQNIKLLARDGSINWVTTIDFLDDDKLVAADNLGNIVVMQWDKNEPLLKKVAQVHVGDIINCFCKGNIIKHQLGSKISNCPTVFFGSTSGSVGLVASLPQNYYEFLKELEY